ncbi:putative glycosidase CRH2 [Coemansia sp. RSA 1199]|nr:putative glycosidase CRH2 [Coemansia sp. RSA 1199]
MRTPALLAVAPLFVAHALGACTGLNAADQGVCPAEQCLELDESFTSSSVLVAAADLSTGSGSKATFVSEQDPNNAAISSGNLVLSLVKSDGGYAGSTAYFTRWIHYGTVTAVVRSGSTTPGVVSSFQLQSDDGSSIDLDWVGASSNRVQANYYTNGQIDLTKAAAPILTADPTSSFIVYKIVWLPDSLTWYANGLAVRTVNRRDTWAEGEQRFDYPDKPARLSFAIWDASSSVNSALTQEWAGSMQTNESKFSMAIKSVTVQCYSNSTLQNAHGSNDDNASSAAEQQESDAEPSESLSKENLSDFGLDREESRTTTILSSSTSSMNSNEDDLSKWLANFTTSAASKQLHSFGVISSLLIAAGLAVTFGA